jgi:large subunit ribosomal protein L33
MAGKKSKSKREKITLECTECKSRDYHTTKNKANNPERMELKKFCAKCRKTTAHKESK